MNRPVKSVALTLALGLAVPALAQQVPAHPDKLTYKSFSFVPPAAKDYRVVLKNGVVAYVAEDKELPLVNIAITLRGGTYLNPAGKEGLAEMVGYLLTRGGTAKRKAEQLDEDVAFLAANFNASIDGDRGSVSMNLLAKDVDEGLRILREVMTEPGFQENKIKLRKDQLLQEMKSRNDDTRDIEFRERRFVTYGESYYMSRFSTRASIESITRQELVDFHKKWFDPRNMVVAVAGSVDKASMVKKLEAFFAGWPIKGEIAPAVPKPDHKLVPGLYMVDKDVPQGRLTILLPGLQRNDPDYFATEVMNDILGGGGFTSRITNRVRSDEGLAYSAGSGLPGGIWFPGNLYAGFQSKSRTVSYATQIVLEEMKKMRSGEVTDLELETSKNQFIEVQPRRWATKTQVVGNLLDEEFTGRYKSDPTFWANYAANVRKVTKADVKRAAEKILKPETATILVVGKKSDLLNPDPKHPVPFAELTGGKVTEVPLRDPYTMKPATK